MSIFCMVIIASKARLLGRVAVGACRQVEQQPRRDLPRVAPAVLAPTAGALGSAVPDDRVPVAVGLLLVFGDNHETHRFIGCEGRAAVQPYELLPQNGEFDGQLAAFAAAGKVPGGSVYPAHMAVRKGGGIELGRLSRFAVVEPQAGHKFGHPGSPSVCRLVAFEIQHPGRAIAVGEHGEALGPEGFIRRHLHRLCILGERVVDAVEVFAR